MTLWLANFWGCAAPPRRQLGDNAPASPQTPHLLLASADQPDAPSTTPPPAETPAEQATETPAEQPAEKPAVDDGKPLPPLKPVATFDHGQRLVPIHMRGSMIRDNWQTITFTPASPHTRHQPVYFHDLGSRQDHTAVYDQASINRQQANALAGANDKPISADKFIRVGEQLFNFAADMLLFPARLITNPPGTTVESN